MNIKKITIASAVVIALGIPLSASADVNQSASIHGNGNTINQSVHITNNYTKHRPQYRNNRYNKKQKRIRKLRRELRRLRNHRHHGWKNRSNHNRWNRGHGKNRIYLSISLKH